MLPNGHPNGPPGTLWLARIAWAPLLDTVHRVDLGERGLCRQDQLGLTLHDRLY
ncbi:hypothetical protein MA4S0726RB_1215 [Mycobacteroides abscessus 4S-0726-RB]|nr:hypothetical protein MA4S0726RA_1634 [Mycobacteroides abscessus 4S-0726-RA]EIU00099.1 hypothetical protein MA4S0303_2099 [Mycobacteroides abscessus 4S-0303]EIU02594.1 hypothetical protein MA4S0726RB_1215 [Mycobacteroides abscessus 4S-0726-RB]EIV13720.1 hypothetical protein MA4S0206_1036 [Mycobacteroides abscessus 4S-0206]EIV52354.1 hypothetical protein MA4S0116R_1877 [Mycobacteroides abscessus 4S-0116-R]EIV67001.1 hypothetical protein MA4S0116S_0766 [Mycobacteroides abscessus 4S-0116-S]